MVIYMREQDVHGKVMQKVMAVIHRTEKVEEFTSR